MIWIVPARHRRAVGVLLGIASLLWGAPVGGPSGAGAVKPTATLARAREMTALFAQTSYSPGQVAHLRVVTNTTRLTVQPIAAFSQSHNPDAPIAHDPPVGPARTVAWHPGAGTLRVRIGRWASGVYFVRVRSAGEQVVAPVVVRPAHLGQAPVAVIVPTYTWQAYNRRGGDTWYVCSCVNTVELMRPYARSSSAAKSMTLIGRFRDLGRPEAALLGAQYLDWNRGIYPNRPYRVVGARRIPWLFAGTRLKNGSLIPGHYGIEIDATTSASPPGTTVIATIPNIFPGETADMTYYTTAAGAEVFDSGTINFGGAAENRYVSMMLNNLWVHMAGTAMAHLSKPVS